MKLIKKMLAIMFAFMMVVGMGTKVNAEEGAQPDTKGSITITNALPKQEYKLYRILELESFNTTSEAYSYKLSEKWNGFISDTNAKNYLKEENGYVTWINGKTDDATVRAFVEEALKYAQEKKIAYDYLIENKTESENSIVADKLPLGYYLVDSSAGALCGLNTTNPNVTINEKNGTPTVEKKVKEDSTKEFGLSNTADIGQTVEFQTTITAQAGAQNYVLHDKMSNGLTFDANSVSVNLKSEKETKTLASPTDYVLKTSGLEETGTICTFHIEFTKVFYDSLSAGDQIIVSYSATLNENAVIKGSGNTNETWLKYGNGTDTAHSTTTTKTYEIPVFKYTGNNKPLAGAKFTLSKNAAGSSPINLIKVYGEADNTKLTYRVAKEGEDLSVTDITTPSKGEFVIQGLDADTYYLTETEAPKGYNKLAAPIKVEINDDAAGTLKIGGQDKIDGVSITQVNVENKTGTLLPSTGGMGTTMIYMAGAILVIASGIVLVSKKRSKAK